MKVTLPEKFMEKIEDLPDLRFSSTVVMKEGFERTGVVGQYGVLKAARKLGAKVKHSPYLNKEFKGDKFDLIINGMECDVKSSSMDDFLKGNPYKPCQKLLVKKDTKPTEAFIFAKVDGADVYVLGWISYNRFKEIRRDFKGRAKHPCDYVRMRDLQSFVLLCQRKEKEQS